MDAPATLDGRYRVVEEISRGGMGVVYRVEHLGTGRAHAAKVLLAELTASPEMLARFAREARLPAQIDSEHIVEVIDIGGAPELAGAPFMVMDLLDGRDLRALLSERGHLSPEETVSILHQVARAVGRAHDAGIVHRDLKPANIFLHRKRDGQTIVKVLDFGVASALDGLFGGKRVTANGEALGTPAYMSPEQVVGDLTKLGPAADIWALGMVAFELLTGQRYWGEAPMYEVIAALVDGAQDAPSQLAPGLTPGFDAWFARSCHRDPTQRFADVREQLAALAGALRAKIPESGQLAPTLVMTDTAIAAPSASPAATPFGHGVPVPAPSPQRIRWWMPLLGFSVAAAAVIGVAAAVLSVRPAVDREPSHKWRVRASKRGVSPAGRATDKPDESVAPQPTGPAVTTRHLQTFDDEPSIQKAVESHFPELLVCYREALKRQPDLSGNLVLMLTWRPKEKPHTAMCGQQEKLITDKALCACISAYARQWQMPEPDDWQGSVMYTVTFRP